MLLMKIWVFVQSEWALPVVFDLRKAGLLRFCMECEKPNAVTGKDDYPILRLDKCLDSLGKAHLFSTLDASFVYLQIEIDGRDKNNTAFILHSILFRFLKFPFALKIAPSQFQNAMDIILSTFKWQFALIYLENVVNVLWSVEEQLENLRTLLVLLSRAATSLKLKKWLSFDDCIDYLGHIIQPDVLNLSTNATDAIHRLYALQM